MNKQVRTETANEIYDLSRMKFQWKTEGALDLLEDLFDDELVFLHINGHITSKQEWMAELRSKRFVYNSIDLKEATVKPYGDTVVLVGKAAFKVTIHGSRGMYHLVYTEVYTRKDGKWKLVNLHTCSGVY
jgi:ketosteroid isomerase-like protein